MALSLIPLLWTEATSFQETSPIVEFWCTRFFYKRRLIFSSTGHLLFLPIFPVLMSLTCLLFFRWWHSSLVKIHADIRGEKRDKICTIGSQQTWPDSVSLHTIAHNFCTAEAVLRFISYVKKFQYWASLIFAQNSSTQLSVSYKCVSSKKIV